MHVRRAELAQQGFEVSLAQNERFPTIKVGPYVSREEAGEIEREAGIGFSLELPIFRNGKAEVTQAQAREAQAEAMINATARELEREIATSALVYQNSYKRLQSWSKERIDSLSEAAELADRHYRLGAVPVSTYIELQENYLEALEAINDVKAEALEAALEIEERTGQTRVLDFQATRQNSDQPKLIATPLKK
jgi:cobalt-zinc-cadmium efflux system outer membrane protein